MGKKKKKHRPFLMQARYLQKEIQVDLQNNELCVECNQGVTWKVGETIGGKTRMHTSPFRVVVTPHGKRRIHDYCLFKLSKQ